MTEEFKKEYVLGDGSTITVEEVRARVSVVEPGVVKFLEPPTGSAEVLELLGHFLQQDGKKFGRYVMVGDLTEANHPSAEYRETIVKWMRRQPCVHTCYVQPAGIVPRVALRFMMGRAGVSHTVHPDMEEALEVARQHLT